MRRGRAARPAGAAAMRKLGQDAHSRGSHGSSFVTDVRGNSCGNFGGFAPHVHRVRALSSAA